MCDYSLAHLRNRLAVKGDELVICNFNPTKGFVSAAEAQLATRAPRFLGRRQPAEVCVVCIPPGAKLFLRNIPKDLQAKLGIGPTEEVIFTQFSAQEYTYRDGIRFENGRQALLQTLPLGLRAVVLSLDSSEQHSTGLERKEVFVS